MLMCLSVLCRDISNRAALTALTYEIVSPWQRCYGETRDYEGVIWGYKLTLRFSRSRRFKTGGNSCSNSSFVMYPARNASQRLLMRFCVWVRDLRVASLHPAESVFLLVDAADLIFFLSFLISLILSWLCPAIMPFLPLSPEIVKVLPWRSSVLDHREVNSHRSGGSPGKILCGYLLTY